MPMLPPRTLPPRELPPVVYPTVTTVEDIYQPYIVPHIHPSHTQYRYHEVYEHRHYCPHTVSETCDVCHYNVDFCQCGCEPTAEMPTAQANTMPNANANANLNL